LIEAGNTDVSSWMPGMTTYENAVINVPASVANGEYRLAVGIFGGQVTGNPKYNIAIEGRLADNFRWYVLCNVIVNNSANSMSAPAGKAPEVFNAKLAATPEWPLKPVNPPDFHHTHNPGSGELANLKFEEGTSRLWNVYSTYHNMNYGPVTPLGGPHVRLHADRPNTTLNALSRPLQAYLNHHGNGRYRYGGYFRSATNHWGTMGHRLGTENPVMLPRVQVGNQWTLIETPANGVTINGSTANANSLLGYFTYSGNSGTGLYRGEVFVAGFFIEYLGP